MPISGIVMTCESAHDAAVRTRLSSHPAITLGDAAIPGRIPAVVETADDRSHRRTLRELEALDDILCVELAFASYEDGTTEPDQPNTPVISGVDQ